MKTVKTLVTVFLMVVFSSYTYASVDTSNDGGECKSCGDTIGAVAPNVEKQIEPIQKIVVNKEQASLDEEFLKAVESVDLVRVRAALAKGANINARGGEYLESALILLQRENSANNRSETNIKRLQLLKFLLDNGINPNLKDVAGFTASMEYARYYDADGLNLLCNPKYKADLTIRETMSGGRGRTALLSINRVTKEEHIPFAIATVKAFLDNKVDKEQKTLRSESLLMIAVTDSMLPEYIIKLSDLGFDINTTNEYGEAVLAVAAIYPGTEMLPVLKHLVENKHANINAKDTDGRTPLDNALDTGNQTVIDYLKSKGAKSGKSK